jgi:hypothetical protein
MIRGLLSFFHMIRYVLLGIFLLVVGAGLFLFAGRTTPSDQMKWGVNFSQKHANDLGLDWRKTYLALLDDLGAKRVKIAAHWDLMEPRQFIYFFEDMDWMIAEAEKRSVEVIPVVGMKTPRWPECHIPGWAKKFDRGSQEHQIRKYVEAFVTRYKDSPAVSSWQVENEPFFAFGDCPWQPDGPFLQSEVDLVRSIDPSREIMITDTGEFSFWIKAAGFGDRVGSTMYRIVWFSPTESYLRYPLPPVYYARRAWILRTFLGKDVINSELQAEPWASQPYHTLPVEEMMKTLSPDQFRANIDYARRAGLTEAYFWGAEWWYWMKETKGNPEYWNTAKATFGSSL